MRLTVSSICFSIGLLLNCMVAQDAVRPVAAAYTLEVGSAHMADTYLSPLKYSGQTYAFHYQRLQAMRFNPEQWVMQLDIRLEANHVKSPTRRSTLWRGAVEGSWAMMHRRRVADGWTVGGGGQALLQLGCQYMRHNGNNPAQAEAAFTLGITAFGQWQGRVGRLPLTVRYQPSLPSIGAFFMQDYGELYYEIYLGNHSGLAHCVWWGNYFNMRHPLTVDLHFGGTSLRVGYECEILSSRVNNITLHRFTHCASVGVSGEWMSLNPRKPLSRDARIISAVY